MTNTQNCGAFYAYVLGHLWKKFQSCSRVEQGGILIRVEYMVKLALTAVALKVWLKS
jgi:hypothetical protein